MKKFKNLSVWLKNPTVYRRLAMAILVIIILIRPTLSTEESKREMSNLNIWFVVDATGSMVAKDVDNGNKRRFEQVQDDVTKVINRIPGAKYGLIVQDFTSYSAVPTTNNADAILAASPYLRPKYSLYTKPSNFTELLDYTAKRISGYKERFPERNNVMIFMSDGEDVSGDSTEVPSNLPDLIDRTIVLGYGSEKGSLIEEVGDDSDGTFDYTAIKEDSYVLYFGNDPDIAIDDRKQVISKIDEENLQRINSALNGDYYHRESGELPDAAINALTSAVSISHDSTDVTTSTGAEIYWIFAIILLALLAWEGEEILTRVISERSRKDA